MPLLVCTTCAATWVDGKITGTPKGEQLLQTLQAAPAAAAFDIQPVACMSACSQACVVTLREPHKPTYIFGNLDPSDAAAVLECMQMYCAKDTGVLGWAERPEPLKRGIVARLPA